MNHKEIRKWMIDTGITTVQIAREARVSQPYVSLIIKGKRFNKLVMTLLRGHGCPEEHLKKEEKSTKDSQAD